MEEEFGDEEHGRSYSKPDYFLFVHGLTNMPALVLKS